MVVTYESRTSTIHGFKSRGLEKKNLMSQEQLALLTTIDRSYLGRIERGKYSITVEKLYQISQTLNVDPKILLP